MEDRAQKTSDSNISFAHGIEDGSRRGGNFIDFKAFVHDQENVEIFRGRFRGYKASPNEDPTQFSVCIRKFQERLKTAGQPHPPR